MASSNYQPAFAALLLLLAACPGDQSRTAQCGRVADSSSLAGVSIVMPEQQCSWTAQALSQGIVVRYSLQVDRDVAGLTPIPQDMGGCQRPRIPGVTLFRIIRGDSGTFCPECDLGPCPARAAEQPVTLERGTYRDSIVWNGQSYFGPSDGNSTLQRRQMPPGEYLLTVSLLGRRTLFDSGAQRAAQTARPNDSTFSVRSILRLVVTK